MKKDQRGYFLIIAVFFILVIGVMANLISYLFSGRTRMSSAEEGGLKAFYIAESGLDVAARLLIGSQLLTCATLTSAAAVTNASLLNGTFTATAVTGDTYSAATTLSSSMTASSTSIALTSATGFAPIGRVRIDSEAISYTGISGNTLLGLTRGVGGTTAASHASGATVSESVCLVDVNAGVPSIASPTYQRELQMSVEILNQDGWIVGNRSGSLFSIERWNQPTESAWNNASVTDSVNRENLLGVSIARDNTGWAVGVEKSNNFTLVRWNGSTWTAAPLAGACGNQDLESVSMVSASDGYAVGLRSNCNTANYQYTVLRWNGSIWTPLTSATSPSIPAVVSNNQNLNAVSMADTNGDGVSDIGFAVGNAGTILKFNGTNWVTDAQSKVITTSNLLGVWTVSASEAWAVGVSGLILKWNGSTWSSVSSPTSNQLNAIAMLDTNNDGLANVGWAVGNSGRIIYYNGSSWSSQLASGSNLFGVSIFNSTNAWAVGGSATIWYWNGTAWASQTSPVSGTLNAISMYVPAPEGTSLTGPWRQIYN